MSKWRDVTLEEICDAVQYGVTASASDSDDGPNLLRITDIVPPRIDWASVPKCKLPEDRIARYELKPNDIVVARTGATVGYAKFLRDPRPKSVFASYLVRFQVGDGADPGFVGQVVQSTDYKDFVASNAGGAAQPNANARVLGGYRFALPDLKTQRRIASFLAAFDELIEINERRIELLERLAQSLYREWFVRFRFPGHGNTDVDGAHSDDIPPGWKQAVASDLIEVNPKTPRGLEPFQRVTMSDLSTRHSHLLPSETTVRASGTKFRRGDVLMARITPSLENGKTGLVLFLDPDETGVGSTEFIVLRGKDVGPAFVYCSARDISFRDHAIKSMSGASGRQRVANDCFDSLWMTRPPRSVTSSFETLAMPMLELAFQLRLEIDRMGKARDLLLPRLVTGELDISKIDLGVLMPVEPE